MDYINFIVSKTKKPLQRGIQVDADDLHPVLFDFQKEAVKRALYGKVFALFEACGLGKTLQQLEWSRHVYQHTGRPVLIVAPLGVTRQTALEEAPKINLQVTICKSQDDVRPGVNITNYELLGKFDSSVFAGVVLDESSILKNFTGTTRVKLSTMFKDTEYKLACTATPSPNDLMELLNHADFLGIMTTAQALSIYFINDMKTGDWRLKGHATQEFYKWVVSWSINIESPEDLGFDGAGYQLPKLHEINEIIQISIIDDNLEDGFFRSIGTSATEFNKEKSRTAEPRAKRAAEIIQENPGEQFIVWCDRNDEADYLKKYIKADRVVEVRGSDNNHAKEMAADDFKAGSIEMPNVLRDGYCYMEIIMKSGNSHTFKYEGYEARDKEFYKLIKAWKGETR